MDDIDSKYRDYISLFCNTFEKGLREIGCIDDDDKNGFIFLFVRRNKPGCIDRASNLSEESIKDILTMVIEEMGKNE